MKLELSVVGIISQFPITELVTKINDCRLIHLVINLDSTLMPVAESLCIKVDHVVVKIM